jgi:peptidyl-dipeptidase Dcp
MAVSVVSFALLSACSDDPSDNQPQAENSEQAGDVMTSNSSDNVLLATWTGPYNGVPAFDKMNLADLAPAMEIGHALHYFSANVTYPTLNGGVRDYTEFQSQLLERWLSTYKVINNYLVHHETGEPIPQELVAKIKSAANFNQGFNTTEYLASALMDMVYHTTDPEGLDVGWL